MKSSTFFLFATLVVGSLTGGCGSSPSSRLPSTDVLFPPLTLQLSWNKQPYSPPPPAIVPDDQLRLTLADWDVHRSAFWPIRLADGRSMTILSSRDQRGQIIMDRVDVYRANGTLEIQQWTSSGIPNEPDHWIVYAADGRERTTEVIAGHHHISEIVFYESGQRASRYIASEDGIIDYQERFNSDGTVTMIHAGRGVATSF